MLGLTVHGKRNERAQVTMEAFEKGRRRAFLAAGGAQYTSHCE